MDEGKEKERRMEEVQEQMTAKRILYRKKDSSWFGSDYNVNLYQGCPHGCIYCDSRSECYGVEHFSQVRAKRDALDLLQKQLASCRKGGMVATGSMSDPYNPLEEKQRLTRGMLTLLLRYSFGVSIATKSSLVERDIDLLEQINRDSKAVVQMTLTTLDDDLCRIIEPNVCPTSRRFEVLCELRERGIPTVVWLTPLLPFINDTEENVRGILELAHRAGCKGVMAFGMGLTLRDGSREYFYEALDRHLPGVKERYIKRYVNNYELPSPDTARLLAMFHEECARYGMMSEPDRIFAYLNEFPECEQLTLF